MQAIITKFHGPTNTKPARYSAECDRGKMFVESDDSLNSEGNHLAARNALVARFMKEDAARYGTQRNPWAGPWVYGGLPNNDVVHVNTFNSSE